MSFPRRTDIELCGDDSEAPQAVRKMRELIAFDRYPPRERPHGLIDPLFGPKSGKNGRNTANNTVNPSRLKIPLPV
jgi:hypothetical protein